MIDNYDSFTYNLVDYIASAGAEVRVERNDAIDAGRGRRLAADATWSSRPGRARPREAGVSEQMIERLAGRDRRCSASASATR